MNEEELKDLKKRLIPFMEHECGKNGISMVFFMLTNILDESSEIICYGEGSGNWYEMRLKCRSLTVVIYCPVWYPERNS